MRFCGSVALVSSPSSLNATNDFHYLVIQNDKIANHAHSGLREDGYDVGNPKDYPIFFI
jgi:hypothetical protein